MVRVMTRLLLLAALLVPGFARAGSVLDAIHQTGALRVGTTGDYKPFTFRNADGSYVGADIVMAHRLAAALGVKLQIVPTSWGALNADFAAKKFDIAMGGVTKLPVREALGPFSPTVLVDGKRPIVRCADRDRYISIAAIDQPSVRLVVNAGGANEAFVRSTFPKATLTVWNNNATVFDEIAAGRQDVMVTDGIEVDHQAALHKGVLCPAAVPAPFTRLEKAYWEQRDPEFQHAVAVWLEGEIGSGSWQKTLAAAMAQP
jgi:cyclohexadienyl dehydratase